MTIPDTNSPLDDLDIRDRIQIVMDTHQPKQKVVHPATYVQPREEYVRCACGVDLWTWNESVMDPSPQGSPEEEEFEIHLLDSFANAVKLMLKQNTEAVLTEVAEAYPTTTRDMVSRSDVRQWLVDYAENKKE